MEGKSPRNKTIKRLQALSEEEKNRLGNELDRLLKKEMSYIVNYYVCNYSTAAKEVLGWDKEDLLQHIRIILWKGIVTFNPSTGFKVTSYLSKILYYQMGNLSKKIQSKKNVNLKIIFPDEIYETKENVEAYFGEDWISYMMKFQNICNTLNDVEKKVLVSHLIYDISIEDIMIKYSLKRIDVIKALREIKLRVEYDR